MSQSFVSWRFMADNKRLVIMYDYDGTLAPGSIQESYLIPRITSDLAIKKNPSKYWERPNRIADRDNVDSTLVYLELIISDAKKANIKLTQDFLKICGSYSKPFKGLSTWFNRINKYGESKGIKVEHYIISTGNYELLIGSPIAKYFKQIYACHYLFNDDGEAYGVGTLINEDSKSHSMFLIRLEEQEKHHDDYKKGNYIHNNDLLPGKNMVYLGDGLTDIRIMNILNTYGGHCYGIYANNESGHKKKAQFEKLKTTQGNYDCDHAYIEGSPLQKQIERLIDDLNREYYSTEPYQLTIFDFVNDQQLPKKVKPKKGDDKK